MEQVAKAPSSFRLRARNPERSLTVGGAGRRAGLDERRRAAVRQRPRRGAPERTHPGPRRVHQADAGDRRAELRADGRRRGDRPPDGGPPHGHGVLHDPVLGQAVHDLRHERPTGARRHPHGRDRARRARGDRGGTGADGHREPELTADLGLPHDRRPDRVGRGEAADRGDPVPVGRRHERGERERRAHAAGGRGAERRRPRPARARGRALPLRVVLHGDRHAHRLAGVRHARVGVGHPRRRAAGAALRAAVPRWGWPRVLARGRRAGRRRDPDDAVGDEPRRDRRRAARRRMARGRPHGVVREVRARRGAAPPVPGAGAAGSASARRRSRSTR